MGKWAVRIELEAQKDSDKTLLGEKRLYNIRNLQGTGKGLVHYNGKIKEELPYDLMVQFIISPVGPKSVTESLRHGSYKAGELAPDFNTFAAELDRRLTKHKRRLDVFINYRKLGQHQPKSANEIATGVIDKYYKRLEQKKEVAVAA